MPRIADFFLRRLTNLMQGELKQAGLAIFPLTLLENLIIASPILFAQGVAGSMRWATLDWP
jgi:hypothetical protein